MEQYNSIQQLLKKEDGQDKKPIFPPTVVQAVFDAKTGASLEVILAQFNSIYIQYQGSPEATRNIIPVEMRRAGLTITYMNMDSETITERASSAVQKDNDHWGLDVNWSRIDELSLSGDIAVSAQGTWIINGVDTRIKAIGPKGDNGLTPWLKTIDNKLHYSYDNETWEECSDYLAHYFRFNATSSDSQSGTIGKIQVSKDGKTWTDLSPEFRNYLRIQGYVATASALPANQAVGTIYGVGPTYDAADTGNTNPIYRIYVYNGTQWIDNGQFTSIAAGVVQETGNSETEVMSQKAVTEKLSELGSKVLYINQAINTLNLIDLESGSINAPDGIEYDNATRIRTKLIPIDKISNISVKDGFKIIQAFYYTENSRSSFVRRVDIVKNDYNVLHKDGENFVSFNFRKDNGDETFSPNEDFGLIVNFNVCDFLNTVKDNAFPKVFVEFTRKGYYDITNGEFRPNDPYVTTDLLQSAQITSVTLNVRGQGVATSIAFFGKSRNYISGLQTNYNDIITIDSVDFPEGTHYIAISNSTVEPYVDGYAYCNYNKFIQQGNNNVGVVFDRYVGRKMCTIGSSSTFPGEWQSHVSKWLDMNFDNVENQKGKGYVRIADESTYWVGLEYSETLPDGVTEGSISASGTEISIWTDGNGNIWRKAFQTSTGGESFIANRTLNLYAKSFDVKWYQPNVVFIMCYNEINAMTTVAPYGSLGTIDDEPVSTPNTYSTIYASYKGVIEYITKNIPMCEIVLVSTKLNTYEVYGDANSTMKDIRNSERYKLDKLYHDAVKEIAEYYGVKFVDLFHNTGITPWSIVDYMQGMTDVHCNSKGQLEYIANNIYKQFMS